MLAQTKALEIGDLRVVVLEDHPLVRVAMINTLTTLCESVHAVYEGADVDEALARMEHEPTDIVILDLDLGTGVPPLKVIERIVPTGVPIVIVSALGAPTLVKACLSAGVIGFVSKQSDPEELSDAVIAALRNRPYTSPEVTAILMSQPGPAVQLSPQEERAAVLYASGMKLSSVARTMEVSDSTAQEYINRVRAKYDAAGRASRTKTDLYRVVREDGLLP
jgi:DNA-binding NarL/FixJ family response regulator